MNDQLPQDIQTLAQQLQQEVGVYNQLFSRDIIYSFTLSGSHYLNIEYKQTGCINVFISTRLGCECRDGIIKIMDVEQDSVLESVEIAVDMLKSKQYNDLKKIHSNLNLIRS